MIREEDTGATPLSPEEADGLRLTHVTTRGELNRWELDNITEAMAWVQREKPTDILNESFVRELHRRMFGTVWTWAGRFRKSDKNLGVAWPHVPEQVRSLCDDARVWLDLREERPDEIAVRVHHRLVSIHPFPNGNGRHARLMTDVLLQFVLHRPPFTWGRLDLTKPGNARARYLAALRRADRGDLGPLLEFARS